MKRTLPVLIFTLLAMALLVLSGCRESNPNPAPQTNVYVIDSAAANTGRLYVKTLWWTGSTYQTTSNVRVTIHNTLEDANANLYLSEFYTNGVGMVDFGFLNYGNYYIQAVYLVGGTTYRKVDIAQIQAGRSLTKNIVLN